MIMAPPRYHFASGKPTAPKERSFIAFDTETSSDGGFICGAFYGELKTPRGFETVAEYCDTEETFKAAFLNIEERARNRKRGFILIGFNTAYDMIYLGDIVASGERLDAGTRFIMGESVGGTKIYDISNHVMGGLNDWIKRLDMEEKYGVLKRGGYLNSEEGKKAQVLDDARATWILTKWVQDRMIKTFGISLTPTKFGAALKIFQRNYFNHKWYRTEREQWKNDFERESYYGGRCEVFQRGLRRVESYDVNSMYVAIMRDELIPNPTRATYLKNPEQILGMLDTEFMTIDCRVRVPKLRIGLLPYRDPNNNGKLIFPWGEWRGSFNSVELREAVKWGAEIIEVYRALWYPESHNYFRDYAQMTMDGRRAAREAGDAAEEQLYKYYGNGLYGKFAQQNAIGGLYIRLSQYTGDLEGLTIIPGAGDYWIEQPVERKEDSWHTFPIISATITAYARAKMLHALCSNGDNAVYCDTDSLKCIGHPAGISIGDNPGQWGYEYTEEQTFYRPKRYGNKRKGIPKKHTLVYADERTEVYRFERPTKFRTAIRRHMAQNVWEDNTKTVSLIDDKREWCEDGTSYPLFVYVPRDAAREETPPDGITSPVAP